MCTGDIDTKSNLIQATGIIGSLRWWTEAILRGMDKFVCDPANDDKSDPTRRCPPEKKDGNKKISQYCPACLVFGATGMRRIFRLEISGGERVFNGGTINIKPKGRKGGWYLGSGIVGKIYSGLISLDREFDEFLVLAPLMLASKWGGIGAKTQHGYGVVEIEDCPKVDFSGFEKAIEKITNQERLSKLNIVLRNGNNSGLPDIKDMFFARVRFEADNNEWWKEVDGIAPRSRDNYQGYVNDQRITSWIKSGSVPISPAIKNWLRYKEGRGLWSTGNRNQDERIENWLFGTTERVCATCYGKVSKDRNNPQNFWCKNCRKSFRKEEIFERIASKINISCAYKINDNLWGFRIWGWIPNVEDKKGGLLSGFNKDGFLDSLKQALGGSGLTTIPWNELLGNQTKSHKLKVWREFNSLRDTVKPDENNISNYLQSLLEGE